jgi:hypothetical protein
VGADDLNQALTTMRQLISVLEAGEAGEARPGD